MRRRKARIQWFARKLANFNHAISRNARRCLSQYNIIVRKSGASLASIRQMTVRGSTMTVLPVAGSSSAGKASEQKNRITALQMLSIHTLPLLTIRYIEA
jgi:hypothetical protein